MRGYVRPVVREKLRHEGDTVDAIERHRMRAELVVDPHMRAFAEQMQIEVAQYGGKAVGIVEIDDGVAETGAQLVPGRAVRQGACEQAGVVDALKPCGFTMFADRLDIRGLRDEGAHHLVVALAVQAEIVKRIGMLAFDDRIGLGG